MSAKKTKDKLIGRQLGDYKLIQQFATGGMAKIYKGVDVHLGRHAAIKVLTKDMLESDEMLSTRFQREAQAVAHLEHDHIVPIYQYGEEEDLYFLAMRLVEGEDFADEINRVQREGKLLSVTRMLHILKQVASALDFAHEHGVIHRDIKPSNILVDKNGKAYLTDFGLVLRQQVDQTMGTAFGTPRYISPEQALASEKVVPQSDVYSLAVIVYEIVTGSMVFKADTAMQLALSHISEPPPPPRSVNPNIPPAVEAEILKALGKDPTKRQQTAGAFITALEIAYGTTAETQPDMPKRAATITPLFRPAELDRKIKEERLKERVPDDTTIPPPGPVIQSPLSEAAANEAALAAAPRRRRSPVVIVLLAVIALAAAGAAGLMALSSAQERSPDTSTRPSPPSTVVVGDEPAALVYNFDGLVVRNESSQDFDVSQVAFARIDGSNRQTLQNVPRQTIPAGACVVITLDNRQATIPAAWNCGTIHTEIKIPSSSFFWRANAVESFQVVIGEAVVAVCDAVQRGGESLCEFRW